MSWFGVSVGFWHVWVEFWQHISLDWHDDQSRVGLQRPGQGQEGLHHGKGVDEAHQEIIKAGTYELDVQGKH